MGWWGTKTDPRSEVERLFAELEEIFLAMPPADQARVAGTVLSVIQAASGFGVLPDRFLGVLGRAVIAIFSEMHMPFKRRPTPGDLVKRAAKGAPIMLAKLGTSEAELVAAAEDPAPDSCAHEIDRGLHCGRVLPCRVHSKGGG